MIYQKIKKCFTDLSRLSLMLLFLLIFNSCGDSAPSTSVTLNIADGANDISVSQVFTATFPRPIDIETVTTDSFFIVPNNISSSSLSSRVRALTDLDSCDSSSAIDSSVTCSSNISCTLTPIDPLEYETSYALCLTRDIQFLTPQVHGTFQSNRATFTTVASETSAFSLGGSVTGLDGTIVLQNNGGDDLSITSDGNIQFATQLADGEDYVVTVLSKPSEQTCVVTHGSGTINGGAISNVLVTCTDNPATITLAGSPLTLLTNGATDTLTITNTSVTVTAVGITSDFTGTALDGNVVETGNTCSSLAPSASCTLTYTPDATVVGQTDFSISGTNTNTLTAAIAIDSSVSLTNVNPSSGTASGGLGFTLTGTDLTGATAITFDGVAATSLNVVNATTVTGVAPAHAAGAVDTVITTPAGSATLTNGFTYLATAVGQASSGGTIACLNGGSNNLVASTADNSTSIEWGGTGVVTGANSASDGSANTATIVTSLGANGGTPYASQTCSNYEVDSQGNTPCEAGNACYSDWFLPSGNNTIASGQLNCLYTNRVAIGGFAAAAYWSSTEINANFSWAQSFVNSTELVSAKGTNLRVRCVRSFAP